MMQALTEQAKPSWVDDQSIPDESRGDLFALWWNHMNSQFPEISSGEETGGASDIDIAKLRRDQFANREWRHQMISGADSIDYPFVIVKSVLKQTSSWRSKVTSLENEQFALVRKREIEDLQKAYVFEEDRLVREFVGAHRSVPQLLLEAVPVLKSFFGDTAVLQLRVISDESGIGTIYGIVLWRDAAEAARSALRKFDESWWIVASEKASGRVMFDYLLA